MIVCEAPDCENEFEPKRSTARFCSATCRKRADRAEKASASESEHIPDPDDETGKAEHTLISVTRKSLEDADALGTVAGQLALQMARRIANPETAGISALSKELRALLAEAREEAAAGAPPEPTEPEPEEEDEVTRARRQRDEARQAAGLA